MWTEVSWKCHHLCGATSSTHACGSRVYLSEMMKCPYWTSRASCCNERPLQLRLCKPLPCISRLREPPWHHRPQHPRSKNSPCHWCAQIGDGHNLVSCSWHQRKIPDNPLAVRACVARLSQSLRSLSGTPNMEAFLSACVHAATSAPHAHSLLLYSSVPGRRPCSNPHPPEPL